MGKDDDRQGKPDYSSDDTLDGGWWQPQDDVQLPDQQAHPREPFSAHIRQIPPDGTTHECEVVELGPGQVLLRKTDPGSLPVLGQMVELEIIGEQITLDGVVVRCSSKAPDFTVQLVNLDKQRRSFLAEAGGASKRDA